MHNLYGKTRDVLGSPEPLGSGSHQVAFEFTKDEGLGGPARLLVDGDVVVEGVDRPLHRRPASTGSGWGSPVATNGARRWAKGTRRPFTFNGRIDRAVVEVTGPVVRNPLAEIAAILAEQ